MFWTFISLDKMCTVLSLAHNTYLHTINLSTHTPITQHTYTHITIHTVTCTSITIKYLPTHHQPSTHTPITHTPHLASFLRPHPTFHHLQHEKAEEGLVFFSCERHHDKKEGFNCVRAQQGSEHQKEQWYRKTGDLKYSQMQHHCNVLVNNSWIKFSQMLVPCWHACTITMIISWILSRNESNRKYS